VTVSELSINDLESQTGELLPEREALGLIIGSFDNHIVAINSAEAVQALTALSHDSAVAVQNVITA
jgi:hypothetical protein